MIRFALRCLLWVLPGMVGASLVVFFVLTRIAPAEWQAVTVPPVATAPDDPVRSRFLDLPGFVNLQPLDVEARSRRAVRAVAAGEATAAAGAAELLRLGAAALPYLLPVLDAQTPAARSRLLEALAPLAARMGVDERGEARDLRRAELFWNRFWRARGVELSEATARSAVRRYAKYGTAARARELRVLDTFALPQIFEVLQAPRHAGEIATARRLVDVTAHATERDDRIGSGATLAEAADAVARWRRWWLVHQNDYRRLMGAERAAAVVLETRYGKWLFETVVLHLGRDQRGRRLLPELRRRASVTGVVVLLGVLLAYLLAVPLGVLMASLRRRVADRAVAAALLVPYVLSPAAVGLLVLHRGARHGGSLAAAVLSLALVLLADPALHQRSELAPVLRSDFVRAAMARGAGPLRVALHALRNAAVPIITRISLELPLAVTACFVLERVFGLHGLGEATADALRTRDLGWLMALSVGAAGLAVVMLVISDVLHVSLDPRVRGPIMSRRRRRV